MKDQRFEANLAGLESGQFVDHESLFLVKCIEAVRSFQCDKMVILLFQYLAIYNNEHLTNTIKMAIVGSKFCQI